MIVHVIYKNWTGARWLDLPNAKAKEMFDDGKRHDALGPWGHLSEVDPKTGVSRDVTDEEVLAYGRSLGIEEDQTGSHLLNRLKSNQLISQLIRGAIQLGYQRQHFKVENHMREGQTFDTPMVHSSCAMLLSKLVAKVMGYRQYTVLAPRAETGPNYVLCIDPFGICVL